MESMPFVAVRSILQSFFNRQLFSSLLWLLHASLFMQITTLQAAEQEFPERARYYMVKTISAEELQTKLASVEIVDVRSNYEFETLHIAGAHNIVLGSPSFINDLLNLRNISKKPLVFYCNGQTCRKSYDAAMAAQKAGLSDVFAYDAGILNWAKQYPAQAVLLGKTLTSAAALISKERLQAHTLSQEQFETRVNEKNVIVLDVRDGFQTDGLALYPLVQRSVSLDNKVLKKYVDQALGENKTLLIFDATGHQAPWLQYYLEEQKVPSYYFLDGGAKGYYDRLMARTKK